ncbi:MAG TPA: PilZ domain-containing protein, partial [Kofleriaceae bacterium]
MTASSGRVQRGAADQIHRRVHAAHWPIPPPEAVPSIADLRGARLVYQRQMEDRRAAPRQPAHVSAALETAQGRSTIAITRDISTRGLLLLTRAALQVGELVKLTVALGDGPGTLSGKVVRVEDLDGHELWR